MVDSEQDFQAALQAVPEALRPPVLQAWEQLEEATKSQWATSGDSACLASLPRVWACSEFVMQACCRHPSVLLTLLAQGALQAARTEQEFRALLESELQEIQDENGLMQVLRRFRRREMVRIAWRDIAGWTDLVAVTQELSWLAEACIDSALTRLDGWLQQELGVPSDAAGEAQSLVVIGMGKLGAWELNFSSDIDLVFAFGEAGDTRDGPRSLSNEEYFTRLGRRLIKVLDQVTEDGFVFRVDMRLRPFGESGPLVLSFDAMEHYYQVHGREWERYAWIKARVVGGARAAGEALMTQLKPFVYRRYLDYGAFASLREMKQMIAQEVQRRDLESNIKLGAGGIREIEFVAQAFQLIRGGREPALQQRRVLLVLAYLAEHGYLPEFVAQNLQQAYEFLRNSEHRLQAYRDQQTHELPDQASERLRLAYAMGYADWDNYAQALAAMREQVQAAFEQVFLAPQVSATAAEADLGLAALWCERLDPEAAGALLVETGYSEAVLPWLVDLRHTRDYRVLSTRGRARMDQLMPLVLAAVGQGEHADITLKRVLGLLQAIIQRSAYLALLMENPMALSQLVRLCRASPWIAHFLTQHPMLLDELLDPRGLYRAPNKAELVQALRQDLSQFEDGDLELAMEELRHFHQTQVLRVAAADVSDAMPLMIVSDHLTWIAEAILDEVLELAWGYLVERHGRPVCTSEGEVCDKGFAVVAYGKLGGIELGYGSDLDVVFLHGSDNMTLETQGPKPVSAPVFFARLGQRMIHILTARTPTGILYEVDTRLRPNGASGLLVSHVQAFAEYQQRSAWTWEHQALVRARVVAGDPLIAEHFAAIRREILMRQRDRQGLRQEVSDMRQRMREANSRSQDGEFDLKQDAGGIADIEFMVQYGVLAWAHKHPALLDYTDTIRLLSGLAQADLVPEPDCALLADAYRAYRARMHRLTLQEQPAVVPVTEFVEARAQVQRIWQTLMEPDAGI